MQKFNKAFAPSTAEPGLRRQEEVAGEKKKEREGEQGGAGSGLAKALPALELPIFPL